LVEAADPSGKLCLKTYAWNYIRDVLSESKLKIDSPWVVRHGLNAVFDWAMPSQSDEEASWTVKEIDDPFSTRTKRTLRDIGLKLFNDGFPVKINFFEQEPESVDVYMALKTADEERFRMFLDDLAQEHS